MVADIVEVIFVDHICNFVQLNARFLRLNFGFPTDVDHDNAFVCGICNENDGYGNATGCTKQCWYCLEKGIISINQPNDPKPHTRFIFRQKFSLQT